MKYSLFYWLIVVLLYWSDEPRAGMLAVAIILTFRIVCRPRMIRSRVGGAIAAITGTSYFLGIVSGLPQGHLAASEMILHLLAMLIFFLLIDLRHSRQQVILFAKIFIAVNMLTLALHVTGFSFFDTFLLDTRGALRYKFIFREPSFLGIYTATLIYLINISYSQNKETLVLTLMLFSIVMMSLSSVSIFLSIIGLLMARKNRDWRKINILKSFYISAIVAIIIFISFNLPFISSRMDQISIGADYSTYIRVIAPWVAAAHILNEYPITGVGFGYLEAYILNNPQDFVFMATPMAEGGYTENTNVDNLYAFLLMSLGPILFLLLIFEIIVHLRRKSSVSNAIFLLSLGFCTGAFIHPLFLGLLLLRADSFADQTKIK